MTRLAPQRLRQEIRAPKVVEKFTLFLGSAFFDSSKPGLDGFTNKPSS
jgi:hypothetical protein